MSKDVIYLAGPMQGYKNFNFPAFATATEHLRALGYTVFSPAERDLERDPASVQSSTGDIREAEAKGFNLREALEDDLVFICRKATAIALLPGWENSKGAFTEWSLARALGLRIIYLTLDFIDA